MESKPETFKKLYEGLDKANQIRDNLGDEGKYSVSLTGN